MGFGFNLFFTFILVPLTGILLLIRLLTGKKIFVKATVAVWLGICGIAVLSVTVQWLTAKKELKKSDYYGQYIVNRSFFRGEQSDWQYRTFRFEIKDNDSIFFYITDGEKILKTCRGTVTATTSYQSARLIINMEQPAHHILTGNPTTYRGARSFYLVFYSPKFNNVFFKKGKWKPIER
jgi:hypothetical protein